MKQAEYALLEIANERRLRKIELRNKGTRYFADGARAEAEADLLDAVEALVVKLRQFLDPQASTDERVARIGVLATQLLAVDRLAEAIDYE